MRIAATEIPAPAVAATVRGDRLAMRWEDLGLEVPVRNAKVAELQKAFQSPIAR